MIDNMLSYTGGVVGLLILILDFIVIFEVINSNRTVSGKLGWSLLVFFFPLVGLIFYFLLGHREQHNSSYTPIDTA
ncbi:hypothetical protein BCR42DRAFT_421590 [Absidia repens]|uniref:Cardiolipin synthase N-terminal domain-containing protein n=1 Tax=Absidia repens TaxID=90262 RepID=A0A1X2I7V9_9FUNG|nr:hypothetical protein BCR42DRAFT_421590 [Absidia repens]